MWNLGRKMDRHHRAALYGYHALDEKLVLSEAEAGVPF